MNQNDKTGTRKTLLYSAVTIVFVFFIIIIISPWGKEEISEENSVTGIEHTEKDLPPEKSVKAENIDTMNNDVDPRLQKITIQEIVDTVEEEPTKEEKEHERLLAVVKQPITSLTKDLSSFVYEGQMKMKMPTFNTDEASYKAGKRYGESEEIISTFKFIKDENGNQRMIQTTQSAAEKYQDNTYNGELRYFNGDYSYNDAAGNEPDKNAVDEVIANNRKNKNEPFVRTNWVKLIQDIDSVIAFEKGDGDKTRQQYSIVGSNPELQKKTTEITQIDGNLTMDEEKGVMTASSITGSAKLHDGYMSGADVSFSITMTLKEIGTVTDADDY